MFSQEFQNFIKEKMSEMTEAGLSKKEKIMESRQAAEIEVAGNKLINFASNNYLGLASHSETNAAAQRALEEWGYGLSSVRFISGTQKIHKELESKLAELVEKENAVLYSSCFDANTGLFESFMGKEDAIFTDQLNHASVIDGIRLSKAEREIYNHSDMDDLETRLANHKDKRFRLIATDGVFSMDGEFAHVDKVVALAEKYNALVMVDDSHSTGFVGSKGQGTQELFGMADKVDIVTSTMGKALGGAMGGFTATSNELTEYLRDFSRPYIFSNSLSPVIAGTTLAVLNLLKGDLGETLRKKLWDNTVYARSGFKKMGITVKGDEHPITPVMLGDAKIAEQVAADLLKNGIFAVRFGFPVVPQGEARIRIQISAAHEKEHLDKLLNVFEGLNSKYDLKNLYQVKD